MDLEAGKIALVTRGKGPIVAKPKMSDKAVDSTASRVTPPAEQEPRHGQP